MTPQQVAEIRADAAHELALGDARRRLAEIHRISCGAVLHHIDHDLAALRADLDRICRLANMGGLPIDTVGDV